MARLIEANANGQTQPLEEVGQLLSQLASAWAEIKPSAQAIAPMEDA